MKKTLKIALAGNPNSGKTTIFNHLTGARQKVGNWCGVTVTVMEGKIAWKDYTLIIYDLPGTYSLSCVSEEEKAARSCLTLGKPDVIINVLDATNLERNLYLGIQLLELQKPLVFAFNMWDECLEKGISIDTDKLSRLLGAPVQTTVGRTGEFINELLELAVSSAEKTCAVLRPIEIRYGTEIREEIQNLEKAINSSGAEINFPSRWYSIKLLENDPETLALFHDYPEVSKQGQISRSHLFDIYREQPASIIAEKRYGFIHGALRETLWRKKNFRDITVEIDRILTGKYTAFPIFGFFMWLLFQGTFFLGQFPMGWIESGISLVSSLITSLWGGTFIGDLLVNGIMGGAGGVLIFLPNILILFLGISILEDTGYMARAAFIMDRIMHALGLHGKSFIPLVMGLGCSVPAIMATRILESKKDRLLTMMIVPFISCSARLPVYVLFAGAFFPGRAANIIFIIYIISFAASMAAGILLRKILFRGEEFPFVMELPPYRIPTLKSVLIHMWDNARHYLIRIGTVVLVFSVLLYILQQYPKDKARERAFIREKAAITAVSGQAERNSVKILEHEYNLYAVEYSALGRFGKFIEPALKPLGFDWRMSVSLVSGLVAKEIVVSSMGILFNTDYHEKDALGHALSKNYSPLIGLTFMIFVLLYTPCLASITVLIRELKNGFLSVFAIFYQLSFAWLASLLIFKAGSLLGF